MRERLIWFGLLLALAIGGAKVSCLFAADEPKGGGTAEAAEAVFPMKDMSILDMEPRSSLFSDLTRGARGECREEPYGEVKAYPKLQSKKPIYGLIRLAADPYDRESGTPFYFVADESGEAPKAEKPEKEEAEEEKEEWSILDTISEALGLKKENKPTPPELPKLNNTYDRLYVDLNGDLDLTNDEVVTPMKKVPEGLVRRYSSMRQCVVFNEVAVSLNFGEGLGKKPFPLIPRLEVQEYQGKKYPGVGFLSAVVRKGNIKLGDKQYQAILAQRYFISGRYDRSTTGLLLTSPDNPDQRERWWGADRLNAFRRVSDTYYTTSTTPLGDKLIVTPYKGPMGVLKMGVGDRDVEKVTIQGSLHTKDGASVGVGELSDNWRASVEPVTECRLPAGDYIPDYVSIKFGDLQFSISENYHSDGGTKSIDRDAWVYGIKIREDKPFVWDFSNTPEVMFTSPAKDQTYHPGDEISVKGVLIDPKLTIMIRRLYDTSRQEEKTVEVGNGRTTTYKTQVSLDPTVTITNSAGKQIAEGPMPFG